MSAKKNSTRLPMANLIIYWTTDWQLCWMRMAKFGWKGIKGIYSKMSIIHDLHMILQSNEANHNFRGEWKDKVKQKYSERRKWRLELISWHGFHSIVLCRCKIANTCSLRDCRVVVRIWKDLIGQSATIVRWVVTVRGEAQRATRIIIWHIYGYGLTILPLNFWGYRAT